MNFFRRLFQPAALQPDTPQPFGYKQTFVLSQSAPAYPKPGESVLPSRHSLLTGKKVVESCAEFLKEPMIQRFIFGLASVVVIELGMFRHLKLIPV